MHAAGWWFSPTDGHLLRAMAISLELSSKNTKQLWILIHFLETPAPAFQLHSWIFKIQHASFCFAVIYFRWLCFEQVYADSFWLFAICNLQCTQLLMLANQFSVRLSDTSTPVKQTAVSELWITYELFCSQTNVRMTHSFNVILQLNGQLLMNT